MPSSSARCTQLPRAVDKVPFYAALKNLRDHLRGELDDLDMTTVSFPDVFLKTAERKDKGIKEEPGVKKEPGSPAKAKAAEGGEKPKRKRRSKKEMEEFRAAQAAAREAGAPGATGDMGAPTVPASQAATSETAAVNGAVLSTASTPTSTESCQQATNLPPPSTQSVMSIEPQSVPSQPPSVPTTTADPSLQALFSNPHELVKQEDTSELAQYGILGALPFMHTQPGGGYAGVPYLPPPAALPLTCAPSWHLHTMQNVPLTSPHPMAPHMMPPVTTYSHYPGTPQWQPPHTAPIPPYPGHIPPYLSQQVSNHPTEHIITNPSHL